MPLPSRDPVGRLSTYLARAGLPCSGIFGGNMWSYYKRTFWGTQIAIVGTVAAMVVLDRPWTLAALFFLAMEAAAVLGGIVGYRLSTKLQACSLPKSVR